MTAFRNLNAMKQPESKKDNYTILVPINRTTLFKTLLLPAIRAAEERNSHIILLNVVRVPTKVRVSKAEDIATERLNMLAEGEKILEEAGCKCEKIVRIEQNLASAIKEIVESRGVDLVIMGTRTTTSFLFNGMIYHQLLDLSCPILLGRDNVIAEFKNIILLDDGLQNVVPMLEHATFLLNNANSKIFVVQASKEAKPSDMLKKNIETFKETRKGYIPEIVLAPNAIKDDIMKIMITDKKEDTCMFYSYSKIKWLKHLFRSGNLIKTDYPVFLFKP